MPSDTDSGIITIISVRLKGKSFLRKEIYGYLQKKLKPLKNEVRSMSFSFAFLPFSDAQSYVRRKHYSGIVK